MIYLSLILSLLTGSASALPSRQSIEIDSKLFFQGQPVASPRILTKEGERAKIVMNDQKRQREYTLEVRPLKATNKKINLSYQVAVKEREGETMSRGLIKIQNNKTGLIYLDGGRIQIQLKVKKG